VYPIIGSTVRTRYTPRQQMLASTYGEETN
jgi:hypothetical protein